MLNYITPIDVAQRLYKQKRFWFHGSPKIKLVGETGSFGKLLFDFGDEVVEQKLYIKDKDLILAAAHMAVQDFVELTNHLIEIDDG